MIPRFEYFEPATIEEACNILSGKGTEARILAGGTDILNKMKDGRLRPRSLINIKRIPGLSGFSLDGSLRLGALTTIHSIETSPDIGSFYPALAYAAGTIGSVQVRCLATVGGNLCNAAPSADTAPILIALSASAFIRGSGGTSRSIPLQEFFLGPAETVLTSGEILTEIQVPPMPLGSAASYYKLSIRQAMDIATVGVAALVELDGDICKDCRIVLGAVAPTPLRAKTAEEALKGQRVTAEALRQAGEIAAGEARPITDTRASAEHRREMVKVVTRRALEQSIGQARRQQ